MNPSSFFPILSGMLGGAASAGVFKGPIQTVEDWWYVNFGHTTNEKAEMLRAKQHANIEAYKNQLLKEASSINPENLKEPELKILGPALEASKYYIDDESLREMFAKLIASSMDKTKKFIVHSSFVEIIKQMEPLDAENLLTIHMEKDIYEIAKLSLSFEIGGYIEYLSPLFLGNKNEKDQNLQASSLANLSRLGLVEITFSEWKNNEKVYDIFKDTQEYINCLKEIEHNNNSINSLLQHTDISEARTKELKNSIMSEPKITNGLVKMTPFGKNFCATCL
ncbi:DUF4393 domain-containing protein [Enterococcus hirae]